MRVALVHPHLFHHPAPSQPAGLAWLGAALRARGHQVRLLDLSFVWNRSRAIPRFLAELGPEVIALGVPYLDNDCAFHALSFLPGTRWIADRLRAASRAPIVAGGWGVSRAPDETLRYLGLRFGFAGGDLARASEWVEAVALGRVEDDIPGSIRWDGTTYRATPHAAGTSAIDAAPAAAAHDLIAVARHEAHGGAAVIPVGVTLDARLRRREPGEIDDEVGVLVATSGARRALFAGLCVGSDEGSDDALLERLAMRGAAIAWELNAMPRALTRERLAIARRGGACAVRLAVDHGDELGDVRLAVERAHRALPVLVEVRVGGPEETPASLESKLGGLEALDAGVVRVVLRPGRRLWEPAADDVCERRGGATGDSYVWPRFGFARELAPTLHERLRAATAARPGSSIDSDAYAPWQRLAHAASRCSGVWPAWRLGSRLADLAKHLRREHIERVPFRNQPR